MRVMHVHDDGTIDAASEFTFSIQQLVAVGKLPTGEVYDGLDYRYRAVDQGQCPCGAQLLVLNRFMRRKMFPDKKVQFDALVTHEYRCPAMSERTRQWVYQNRKLALR